MGRLIIDYGDAPVKVECETGKVSVSDGYHTFDELYDHRCLLFLAWQAMAYALAKQLAGEFYHEHAGTPWKSRKHNDGSSFEGWFIAGLTLQSGQITCYIPDKYWDLCKAHERETAPEWDGHTPAGVLARIEQWLKN